MSLYTLWKNDYQKSLALIDRAVKKLGADRVIIASSCSLLHSQIDLAFETTLDPEIKNWMAFAR